MRAAFPTAFLAVFLGKSREAGEFQADDRTVAYPDAYDFAFESSEGLTQTVRMSLRDLDQTQFDARKAQKYEHVEVRGDVVTFDGGAKFKPVEVKPVGASAKSAA